MMKLVTKLLRTRRQFVTDNDKKIADAIRAKVKGGFADKRFTRFVIVD